MSILLGAIADDFTGATDLANTLVKEGMRTVQVIGVPQAGLDIGNAEAVVVALKSRTAPVDDAVGSSLAAFEWLRAQGAAQFFHKYCSTFDSTAEGNIGPVADALLEATGAELAIVCPGFPATGRTIYKGHLFVGDVLLSESSMKDHPLTPMRDSSLVRLMAAQSRHNVGMVTHDRVVSGAGAIRQRFGELKSHDVRYAVVDALVDSDLRAIGEAIADHRLITGGSGVALGLPENFRVEGKLGEPARAELPTPRGRAAVLAGSCSQATRGQIARVKASWPTLKLDADRIAAGEPVVEEALDWAATQGQDAPVLIFSSADPEEVAAVQARHGRERAGAMMEDALGRIACGLAENDVRRLIVAGGETSGAVVSALGIEALKIGPEIDPGVPWTETIGDHHLALALKSGNFGGPDFFAKALDMLP